jgi:hypothetical protein
MDPPGMVMVMVITVIAVVVVLVWMMGRCWMTIVGTVYQVFAM